MGSYKYLKEKKSANEKKKKKKPIATVPLEQTKVAL